MRALALTALLCLAACGVDDSQPVGGVTKSEAQALNDAAAMLDERAANSAVSLPAPAAANAAVPANAATR